MNKERRSTDRKLKGAMAVVGGMRRVKFGGPENSFAELKKLKLDAFLGEHGVLVRRSFNDQVRRMAMSIKRGGRNIDAVVILGADIRNLGEVNDEGLGGKYHVGDWVIRNAAVAMADHLRAGTGDTLGRVGGDELLAVIPISLDSLRENGMTLDDFINQFPSRIDSIKKQVVRGLDSAKDTFEVLQVNDRGQLNLGWKVFTGEDFSELVVDSTDPSAVLQGKVSSAIYRDKHGSS